LQDRSCEVSFAIHVYRVTRLFFIIALLSSPPAFSATWFVATNGVDSNTGTSNSPFATIMRAQTAAASNDIVYLRGGTYLLSNANLTTTNSNGPRAIVNEITKNGINYFAYPGELPVFDLSNVRPPTNRVTAFHIKANKCAFRGFDVVGVQVTITNSHTQSENFYVDGGSNNRFEQLRLHDGMANGWYLTGGSSNLVLNCDAYNNTGLDSGSIGNTDGFGCHPSKTNYTGNILIGCRAWVNSDDGYDCINAFALVIFSNCWSFYNGYSNSPAGLKNSGGDGNGIKGGGYGVSASPYPTNNIPHHTIEFCLTVSNRANGFYANHHLNGQVWLNNTAYQNSVNYNMLCNTNDSSSAFDVPGFNHVMKNNLGFSARSGTEVSNLGTSNDVTFNYFTLPVTVSAGDFVSLDTSLLTAPRQTNGALPYIAFLQLANGSDLVDAGTNINFAYAGAAPDLGEFERDLHSPPVLALSCPGTNLVFNLSNGWAGGTNYLIASTDLALPFTQWPRVVTNKFDLAGNCVITNLVPAGSPQQFYRVSLP
jgi:pectate lyase